MFGRRNRKVEREAAREAERRALFAELAQRPDTVCPFLGMADARTKYVEGVSDGHRCYAFGDPAELSAEQQTKVCLQRGYGNCPRYRRGVLVIPTEELEALRRPMPPSARPTAPVPAAPARRGGFVRSLLAVLGVLVLVGAIGGAGYWYLSNRVESSARTGTLPGGAAIRAELVSLSAPADGAQRLRGTAFVGEAVAVADTTIIYVLDVSRTTRRANACGGDQNDDGRVDSVLDCEIASATQLNEAAIGRQSVSEVGLVGFAAGAVTADLDPAEGPQPLVEPSHDGDANQTPDVVEVLQSAFTGETATDPVGFEIYAPVTTQSPTTDFSAGITAACEALETAESPNKIVVFLSDGLNLTGDHVSTVLPCASDAVFYSFAVGTEASCSNEPLVGGLETIASLTGGTCTDVPDLTKLPEILGAVVLPQIVRVQLTVDGQDPIDISQAATPTLPESGPATIQIDYPMPPLAEGEHDICITVLASDAGGTGSVESCSPVGSQGGRLTSD